MTVEGGELGSIHDERISEKKIGHVGQEGRIDLKRPGGRVARIMHRIGGKTEIVALGN